MAAFLTDGFPTIITFNGFTFVTVFKEKDLTPPSVMGGGPNDTTTMRNTRWRTRQPKKLLSLDQMQITVAYDPRAYDTPYLINNMQVNQLLEVKFSDLSKLNFWGWLDEFRPNPCREGEQPTAVLTVHCSNQNTSGAEVAPVYAAA